MAPLLFTPITIRGVTLRNRIVVSPMCQYSSVDGFANEWHVVHLGSRSIGGAGVVLTEAAAVTPDGRISPDDLGIWKDEHVETLARIFAFAREHGAAPGVQLAHAGRKASRAAPFKGGGFVHEDEGGWSPLAAPSAIPFDRDWQVPLALDRAGITGVVEAFARATARVLEAGGEVVELHAAHGYLLHEFLSPLSNTRDDEYGGTFDNRTRIVRETVAAIREVWPERLPLFVRLSATDWADGGWTPEDTVALARQLAPMGVDLLDCSSGGNVASARIPVAPGYQTTFAARVRQEAGVATAAVGLITTGAQAEHVLQTGQADLIVLARALLRDPYWPLHAARELGGEAPVPPQYLRAFPTPR